MGKQDSEENKSDSGLISQSSMDSFRRLEAKQEEKEEFSIPTHNISFTKAIDSLLSMSPKALKSFMFRFVASLSIVQLKDLELYVVDRQKRMLEK